jgi:hypothetical protein
VQVDHTLAITHGGDDDAHNDTNRRGLCLSCHDAKSRLDLGQKQRVGCDINGYPIGKHPWNQWGRVKSLS